MKSFALFRLGVLSLLLGCGDELPHMAASVQGAPDAWLAMPESRGLRYALWSSADPGPAKFDDVDYGNKDFNNFVAVCGRRPALRDQIISDHVCDPGLEGYLIASDDEGPGFISRLFFPEEPGAAHGFGTQRIRIYTDDLTTPAYDTALSDWRNGSREPFVPPLTAWTSAALVSRVAIGYEHKLRVLLDGLQPASPYYYHVGLQRGAASELGQSSEQFAAMREGVQHPRDAEVLAQHDGAIAPGQTLTLLDAAGSGRLRQLSLSLAEESAEAALGELVLRIYWEQRTEPAVDLPLASLFGARDALAPFETLPMSVRIAAGQVALELSWPMPFFTHARVVLRNRGQASREVSVRVVGDQEEPAGTSGHFHAVWNERRGPFHSDERYMVAAVRGRGKYVGTLMYMHGSTDTDSATPYPLGFLEGDERVSVDGRAAVLGTGTEDYFDAGWYFRDGRFASPFSALIARSDDGASGLGSVTAARWHLLGDAIEFADSFELSFEYGANRPQAASDYASVAFYYASDLP